MNQETPTETSKQHRQPQRSIAQLNSKLIKQILDCCQMYPAAPALNLVPHAMLLRAARKVGLVVDYQQLRWSDRMSEQFIAECFLLVAEQNKQFIDNLSMHRGDDML